MNFLVGITPLLSNTIMSQVCPTQKDDGIDIPARPPSKLFGIVWPILFITLGVAWVKSRNSKLGGKLGVDVTFGALTISLLSWQYFNNCMKDKKLALYNIMISWTLSLLAAFVADRRSPGAAALVVPTTGWLFLASMLNYTQVNSLK